MRPVASYVVPSCCLTWHSSCKASLFTIWNLSQVVILVLERCVFCLFLEAYSVFHDSVLFIFSNLKILCFVRVAKLLPIFKWLSCKVSSVTLWNASEVTFWSLNVTVFLHLEVYLGSDNFLFFFFFFNSKILHSIRGLFSFFSKFKKIYFFLFSETD